MLLLLVTITAATPPSKSEWLYAAKVLQSDPGFNFMISEDNSFKNVEYSSENDAISHFILFNVTGDAGRMTIKIDDTVIMSEELSSLKTANNELYLVPDSFREFFIDKDLGSSEFARYNNSILNIYLDDRIVRSYRLGHSPAYIKGYTKPSGLINNPFFIIIGLLLIAAIALAAIKIMYTRKK